MAKIIQRKAQRVVKRGAEKVTIEDLKKVADRAAVIEEKFKPGGPLGRFNSDAKILLSLIRDFERDTCCDISWSSVAAIVFAFAYVLDPLDIIPDFRPWIGYEDDAIIVAACLALIEQDLKKYVEWKEQNC